MDASQRELATKSIRIALILAALFTLLLAGFFIAVKSAHLSFYTVAGHSMEPTLAANSYLIVREEESPASQLLVFFPRPEAWEYAKANISAEPDVLIKRIYAVAGDVLSYDGKAIRVNGKTIQESALLSYPCTAKVGYSHRLNSSELFVMGDNAERSLDSRRVFCDGKSNFYVDQESVQKYGRIVLNF